MSKSLGVKSFILFFLVFNIATSYLLSAQKKFGNLDYKDVRENITIGVPKQNFTSSFKDTIITQGILKQEGEQFTYIGKYKNDLLKFKCELFYSNKEPEGISELYITSNDSIIFKDVGNLFHFKGETMYVEGNVNQLFDKKKKYILEENTYKEKKQPLYNVGLKGKLKKPIKLYQSKHYKNELAMLPVNYPIEIIAAYYKGDSPIISSLLIKTKLGLMGWIPMKIEYSKGNLIKEFVNHSSID